MAAGGSNALGAPVISCYMNPEKRFAFVEFRSVEECSNAMALDGITCQVGGPGKFSGWGGGGCFYGQAGG